MSNRKEIVCTAYLDAVETRAYNKRLVIRKENENENFIEFTKALSKDESPEDTITRNFVIKEKVVTSILALSDEGIRTLYQSLGVYLELRKL